jgi:hypothetical protein
MLALLKSKLQDSIVAFFDKTQPISPTGKIRVSP